MRGSAHWFKKWCMLKIGRYRHYKGKFYEVIGIAEHSETGEKLVVYRPEYGERGLWVRPLEMFTEILPSGEKRFEYEGGNNG